MPWINAKYKQSCFGCSERVEEGDKVFYDYHTRRVFCGNDECGGEASRQADGVDAGRQGVLFGARKRNVDSEEKCKDCFHSLNDHNLVGCKLCPCMKSR